MADEKPLHEAERLGPAPPPPEGGPRRRARLAAIDIGPLRRHREYRLLWIGLAVSFFGSEISYVAVPYQVYKLTGSTAVVGLLALVALVPLLLSAIVGEAFAAALGGFLRPSLDSLTPRLVEKHELTAASALDSLRFQIGLIGGPAVGGVLISTIGLPGVFAVDIATFLVSLTALTMMRAVPPPPDAERPSLRRIAEGFRYARSRPELLGTYGVDIVAMFFGMPTALYPAFARNFGGPSVLGP